MQRKRGKLSNEEMKYIRENCFNDSLEDMAQHLNRTIQPIKKYIDKQNLKARDLSDDEHLLSTLRTRYYFQELKRQFSDPEIIFFEHMWIDFWKQFNEDIVHTEEMEVVECIRTEILINRSMIDRQDILKNIDRLDKLIDLEMDQDESVRDPQIVAMLQQQMGSLVGAKSSYIHEHEKLLTKKERLLKDLKGTREQRRKVADDAKTNFLLWMRQLDDLETKDHEGYDMEVHRVAGDNARKRLAEYHEYEDGIIDQPLLNTETVKNEE